MTNKELQEQSQAQNKLIKIFEDSFHPTFGNLDHIRINQELAEIKKLEHSLTFYNPAYAAYTRELKNLVDKKKNAIWLIKKINAELLKI